jgi:repressor of nif and glnA expression
MTKSEEIVNILRRSEEPLSIDQICKAMYGRTGDRERSFVRVNLHRLDARGLLIKYPQTYSLARKSVKE